MKLTLHHYRIITITVNILLMVNSPSSTTPQKHPFPDSRLRPHGVRHQLDARSRRIASPGGVHHRQRLPHRLPRCLPDNQCRFRPLHHHPQAHSPRRRGKSLLNETQTSPSALQHGVVLFSGCITHVSIALYSFIDLSRIKTTSSKIYTRRILKAHQDAFIRNKTLQRNMLDNLHQILQCCGANSYADYSKRYNMELLPRSCCKNYEDPCKHPFTQGCTNAVIERTREILWVAGILSIVAAIVACIGAFFVSVKTMKMWHIQEDEDSDDDFDDDDL
ncbi:uncharacterized protein LOC135136642 isoform X1 [Zophobas morio]|uniref:uncharacterized protein LOC135136642 isoform X1 n=1 Tax=Zophobas morio TaxID=2755281 RepID=UPI00308342A1